MNEPISHPMTFVGILGISEEEHCLALLFCEPQRRFLPIWLGHAAASSLCLANNSAWGAGPPSAAETLWEKMDSSPDRICSLHIDNHNDGVFLAHALCDSGEHLDLRVSDILRMSIECDLDILVNEDCLMQSGLRLTSDSLKDLAEAKFVQGLARERIAEIIHLLESEEQPVADSVNLDESVVDSSFDRDFEELMGNLGFDMKSFDELAEELDETQSEDSSEDPDSESDSSQQSKDDQ